MTKKSSVAVAVESQFVNPTSVKDFAVRQSQNTLQGKALAYWFDSQFPSYPEGFGKGEVNALELAEGYMLTYATTPKGKTKEYGYIQVASGQKHFVEVVEGLTDKPKETMKIGVHYAMSMTGQAFGALRTSEPDKHAIIKEIREGFQKYVSNCKSKLEANLREVRNEKAGIKKEKAPIKAFKAKMTDIFADAKKSITSAIARGDDTADKAKFDRAVKAFWTEYNK